MNDRRIMVANAIWNEWIRRGNVRGIDFANARAVSDRGDGQWSDLVANAFDSADAAIAALDAIESGEALAPTPCLACGGEREDAEARYCRACQQEYDKHMARTVTHARPRRAKRAAGSTATKIERNEGAQS